MLALSRKHGLQVTITIGHARLARQVGQNQPSARVSSNQVCWAWANLVAMSRPNKHVLVGGLCAALGACSLAPPYQRPPMPTPPDTYRGAADWKLAQPADDLGRGT